MVRASEGNRLSTATPQMTKFNKFAATTIAALALGAGAITAPAAQANSQKFWEAAAHKECQYQQSNAAYNRCVQLELNKSKALNNASNGYMNNAMDAFTEGLGDLGPLLMGY